MDKAFLELEIREVDTIWADLREKQELIDSKLASLDCNWVGFKTGIKDKFKKIEERLRNVKILLDGL